MWPPPLLRLGSDLMKRSEFLLVLALTPWVLAGSGLRASDYRSESWYPERPPYEADPGGGYIDSYGDPYIPADELAAARRDTGPRVAEPYQRPPSPWRDPGAHSYYPGHEDQGGWGLPALGDDRPYSGTGRPAWELPPQGRSAYRFRGDEALGGRAWGGVPERDGYRFRPLSDLERDRIQRESQWWSGPAIEPRGRAQPRDPGLGDDAFGYEPNNWFRRHYGDRP